MIQYNTPPPTPITVSGTSHQRRSGIKTLPFEGFRFKSTTTYWYFDSGGQITIAKRQPPRHNHPPCKPLKVLVTREKIPVPSISHHFPPTNQSQHSFLFCTRSCIDWQATRIFIWTTLPGSLLTLYGQLCTIYNLVIRWCRNVPILKYYICHSATRATYFNRGKRGHEYLVITM